jgi:hypothetical protein
MLKTLIIEHHNSLLTLQRAEKNSQEEGNPGEGDDEELPAASTGGSRGGQALSTLALRHKGPIDDSSDDEHQEVSLKITKNTVSSLTPNKPASGLSNMLLRMIPYQITEPRSDMQREDQHESEEANAKVVVAGIDEASSTSRQLLDKWTIPGSWPVMNALEEHGTEASENK